MSSSYRATLWRMIRPVVFFALSSVVPSLLWGCATYPDATETAQVEREGAEGKKTYRTCKLAEESADRQTREIAKWKANSRIVELTSVRFVPISHTGLIPFVVSHWTVGLEIKYGVAKSAKAGKHTVRVECFDAEEKRIAATSIPLNVKKSKAEAELLNGIALVVFGLLAMGPHNMSRLSRQLGGSTEPDVEALSGCCWVMGLVMFIYGLCLIAKALFA